MGKFQSFIQYKRNALLCFKKAIEIPFYTHFSSKGFRNQRAY